MEMKTPSARPIRIELPSVSAIRKSAQKISRHRDYTGRYVDSVMVATWQENLESLLRNREKESAAGASPERLAFLEGCIARHQAIDAEEYDRKFARRSSKGGAR